MEYPEITLRLTRSSDGRRTSWRLFDRVVNPETARKQIGSIVRQSDDLPGSVRAADDVPLEDVVRALDLLREAKVEEISFGGGSDRIVTRRPRDESGR